MSCGETLVVVEESLDFAVAGGDAVFEGGGGGGGGGGGMREAWFVAAGERRVEIMVVVMFASCHLWFYTDGEEWIRGVTLVSGFTATKNFRYFIPFQFTMVFIIFPFNGKTH